MPTGTALNSQGLVRWPNAYPGNIAVGSSEVICWRLEIDSAKQHELVLAFDSLTPEEQQRFHEFRFTADKVRFSLGRLLLRKIVEESLGESFALRTNDFGKPELASGKAKFNISHSGNILLVAVSRKFEVGVDVEKICTLTDRENIESVFNPAEINDINSLPLPMREQSFYDCWVRKEAISKAYGQGLSLSLKSYRVSCLPQATSKLLQADWGGTEDWTLRALALPAGYTGAVAIRSNNMAVRCVSVKLTI